MHKKFLVQVTMLIWLTAGYNRSDSATNLGYVDLYARLIGQYKTLLEHGDSAAQEQAKIRDDGLLEALKSLIDFLKNMPVPQGLQNEELLLLDTLPPPPDHAAQDSVLAKAYFRFLTNYQNSALYRMLSNFGRQQAQNLLVSYVSQAEQLLSEKTKDKDGNFNEKS